MSKANLLELLPPRQAAPPPVKPVSIKPNQPVAKTPFSHKLEKAKKEKSASAVKKPAAAPAAQKASTSAKTGAKPETSTDEKDSTGDPSADAQSAKDPKDPVSDPLVESSDTKRQTEKAAAGAQPAPTNAAAPLAKPKTDASKKKADDNSNEQQGASSGKDPRSQQPLVKAPADTSDAQNAATQAQAASASNSASSPDAEYGSNGAVSARDLSSRRAVIAEANHPQSSDAATANGSADSDATVSSAAQSAASTAVPSVPVAQTAAEPAHSDAHADADAANVTGLGNALAGKPAAPLAVKPAAVSAQSPQARFVEQNQPKIVSSIQGQLLPNGGTMQLKLNPEELGSLQVTVHMHDGVMSAAFETSSDHATKLLSHSLGQLKSGLEASGVTVEKLQVERAPQQDAQSNGDSDSKQPPQEQQQQAQQDQQRREMVQRMWRKLSGADDPLDLVA